METLLAARDDGLVTHLGVTGHDLGAPAAHHEALRRYDFDTVMFPVYPRVWSDPVYRADAEALLATCAQRDVGAMAIKAVARRPWGEVAPPLPSPPSRTNPDSRGGRCRARCGWWRLCRQSCSPATQLGFGPLPSPL